MNFSKFLQWILVSVAVIALTACGGGGSNTPTDGGGTTSTDGGITSNTYSLVDGKNSAIMGALKNANVKVYKYTNIDTIIAETTTGNLGEFSLSLTAISDTELLLVEVRGGFDIDTNDDGELDSSPTENRGMIRGWVKASDLKNGNGNITLLSEIVYNYTKHLIGHVHQDDFEQALDSISKRLFKSTQTNISYSDIKNFNPLQSDMKDKLNFDYGDLIKESSLASFIYLDSNNTTVEAKLKELFSTVLSMRNQRLAENTKYKKITLSKPIHSIITSSNSIISVDYDNNISQLIDFVINDSNISFTISLNDNMKLDSWSGCDRLSDDLKTCYINTINRDRRITPRVSYIENIYADNVKDISGLYVVNNDTNYTISLDLNVNQSTRDLMNSINLGDIIVSVSDHFFRKVDNINKVDDYNYKLETSDASLLELYKQGSISVNRNITHDDLVENLDTINRRLSKDHMILLPSVKANDDQFVLKFNENINENNSLNRNLELSNSSGGWVELKPGIKVKGDIKFKFGVDFDTDIGFFSQENLRFITTQTVDSSLSVELSQSLAGSGEMELYNQNGVECKRTVDGTYECKLEILKIPSNFVIQAGPISISIPPIAFGMGAESKLEAAATITCGVSVNQKVGFQVVGSIYDHNNYDGIYDLNFDGYSNVDVEGKLTLGGFVYLEPKFLIYGMAGFEIEPKVGIYLTQAIKAELLNGVEATQLYSKWDAKASTRLNWTWNNYLARFKWAEKFQNKLNIMLIEKEIGFESVFTLKENKYYLLEEKSAYLELLEGGNINEETLIENPFNKTYSYKIKNTGDKVLDVVAELEDGFMLSSHINIYPTSLSLEKNEEGYISVNIDLPSDTLTPNWHQSFISLKNTSSLGTNEETGTRDIEINMRIKDDLLPPSNLNVSLIGESIKKISFEWNNVNSNNPEDIKISISDFYTTTNSCSNAYLFFTKKSVSNTSLDVFYDEYKNILVGGKKYCFVSNFIKGDILSNKSNHITLEIPEFGSIKTSIKDREGNPIENARVYLTTLDNNDIADGNGNIIFESLMPGTYLMTVEADGFINTPSLVVVNEAEETSFEGIRVIEEELEGTTGVISGKIINALNSSNIDNVTIEVREGNSNTSGEVIASTTTDSNGQYSFTLLTGNYTFSITKSGYTSSFLNVLSIGNETTTQDLSLSPILSAGEMRIVLRWGETPSDLDSHLVKKTDGVEDYHIYYSNRTVGNDSLDRDDTDSVGPETVTISNVDSASVYTYYVYNYSHSSSTELKNSSATIDISYGEYSQRRSVPNEDGYYWKVFEIVNGEVVLCTTGCVQDDTSTLIRSIDREDKDLFRNLPSKN